MNDETGFTAAESNAIFRRLRELKSQLRGVKSQHDSCIVLITACICEGFNTRKRIIGSMVHLGFNKVHVILMLKEGQGPNASQHRWILGDDGRYTIHVEAGAAA